jgi:hypothetical protein
VLNLEPPVPFPCPVDNTNCELKQILTFKGSIEGVDYIEEVDTWDISDFLATIMAWFGYVLLIFALFFHEKAGPGTWWKCRRVPFYQNCKQKCRVAAGSRGDEAFTHPTPANNLEEDPMVITAAFAPGDVESQVSPELETRV